MHATGYPPGYYSQRQAPFRPPSYPHGGNPSFQSMTSHWNLTTPPSYMSASHHQPHTPVTTTASSSGSSSSSKKHQLGQIGSVQQPKPPDKPLLPYMRYSRKMWEELKAEGRPVWEVGKIIGQKWREMPEQEKQQYIEEYDAEKAVYNEQMRAYKNSPAYKRWMEAVKQQEQAAREMREAAALGLPPQNDYGPPPPSVIAPPKHTPAEARMQLIQQEDEEDEYITMKQLAAVRFHRNHRLMAEIFNDLVVPTSRSAVSDARIQLLRKQVEHLMVHQRRQKADLDAIQKRFLEKKTKFLCDSENFRRELKKIQDNPPTTWKKPPAPAATPDLMEPPTAAKYTKL